MKRFIGTVVAVLVAATTLLGLVGSATASELPVVPKIGGCVGLNIKAKIAVDVANDKLTVLNAQLVNANADLVKAQTALSIALTPPSVAIKVTAALAAVNSAKADVVALEAKIAAAAKVLADAKIAAAIDNCKGSSTTTTVTATPPPSTTVWPASTFSQVKLPTLTNGVGTGA